MKPYKLDPIVKLIAAQKRKEVEKQYEIARLRRLAKNLPITGEWYAIWSFYKQDAVDKAVLDFLAP